MSVKDLAKYIGQTGTMKLAGLSANVKILDVRQVYGNLQFSVTLANGGYGDKWVMADSVKLSSGQAVLK